MRRSAIGLVLLVSFVSLVVIPARHALLEIWPARVQELVLADGNKVFRISTAAGTSQDDVARTYPLTLLALEFRDGRLLHGFPVYDDVEAGAWWIQGSEELLAVDATDLYRYYTPNAMTVAERLALMRDRLRERRSGRMMPSTATRLALPERRQSAEGDHL